MNSRPSTRCYVDVISHCLDAKLRCWSKERKLTKKRPWAILKRHIPRQNELSPDQRSQETFFASMIYRWNCAPVVVPRARRRRFMWKWFIYLIANAVTLNYTWFKESTLASKVPHDGERKQVNRRGSSSQVYWLLCLYVNKFVTAQVKFWWLGCSPSSPTPPQ